MREGCYACLLDALDIYERVARASTSSAAALLGVFDTSLLLHVRSEEIGLDADAHLARARSVEPRLADPSAPTRLEAADLHDMLGAGRAPEDLERSRRPLPELRAVRQTVVTDLEGLAATNLTAAYLYLALACQDFTLRERIDLDALPDDRAPLLAYRLATCPGRQEPLGFEAGARWDEIAYFEARRLLGDPTNIQVPAAVAHLERAAAAFPDSPAVLVQLAYAQRTLGRLEAALVSFDAVLRLQPAARDALVGQLVTLSYLERHPDAIFVATRLIDLGTWHLGDAYYWRAWNRLRLRALDDAEADAARALTLLANTSVYALAGTIAFERHELEVSRERLERAREIDESNCQAAWVLGLVEVEERLWEPAAAAFIAAVACYRDEAAHVARELAAVSARALPDEMLTRQVDQHRRAHEEALVQEARAAFNAAQALVQLGRHEEAREQLPPAIAHPVMREKAEALLTSLPR